MMEYIVASLGFVLVGGSALVEKYILSPHLKKIISERLDCLEVQYQQFYGIKPIRPVKLSDPYDPKLTKYERLLKQSVDTRKSQETLQKLFDPNLSEESRIAILKSN